jgi:hypothetical protein
MDDLSQVLLNFINNPENKEKIQEIKEKFMNSTQNSQEEAENTKNKENLQASQISPDALKILSKVMPLISSAKKDDSSTRFLSALRPLLNEKRKHKLDESMKIMQMIKIIPMLKESGLI